MTEFLLDSQVAARNEVNAKGNEIGEELREFFLQRINQKVIKVTPYRTWTAKVKNELEPLIDYVGLAAQQMSITFETSFQYNVYATLKKRFDLNGRTYYQRRSIYACSLRDLCVAEFKKCEPERTDYTVEEISAARKRIAELDREISSLKGLVNPFDF